MTLKELIKKKRYSCASFGRELNVSGQTIHNWHNSPGTIPLRKAIQICKLLGVNMVAITKLVKDSRKE